MTNVTQINTDFEHMYIPDVYYDALKICIYGQFDLL